MTTIRRAPLALFAVTALALSACGTTSTSESASGASGATGAASGEAASTFNTLSEGCDPATVATSTGPVSMTDGVGRTVELDQPASRVAVLEWQQTEDVLSLCLTPVAVADPEGYSTYVSAETLPEGVADAGQRGEPDLDAIYAQDPDLVVVEVAGVDDEILSTLESRGVPVLATIGADANGQIDNTKKVVSLIAQATGRTERAEQLVQEFDDHLAEGHTAMDALNLPVKEFLFFDGWVEAGNVVIRPYGEGAQFSELGADLGLTPAWTDDINASYGSGGIDPAYGLSQTDIEGLTAVGDATLIYSGAIGEDSYVTEMQKSPIWNELPAVREGRAYAFPPSVWGAGGLRSIGQAIDAFVDVLSGK